MTGNHQETDMGIVRDIRTHLGQLEDRITSMEHRMASLEGHLSALLVSLGWGQEPREAPPSQFDRMEHPLELAGGP